MVDPLPPTPTPTTQRLVLRPLSLEDAPAIQAGFADWHVLKHLSPAIPWPYPADGAEKHTLRSLEARAKGEKFFWVLAFKNGEGKAIGGIDLGPDVGNPLGMRGFWLARVHWGRGLMTEAAERETRYAFEELGWPCLRLSNAAANAGSRRIKEKQGAKLVDVVVGEFRGGPGLRQMWLLEREAWLASRRQSAIGLNAVGRSRRGAGRDHGDAAQRPKAASGTRA